MYAADPLAWRDYLGAEGACEAFLREGKILPMGSYISAEELEMHSKILMGGGYTGPLNWLIPSPDSYHSPHVANN